MYIFIYIYIYIVFCCFPHAGIKHHSVSCPSFQILIWGGDPSRCNLHKSGATPRTWWYTLHFVAMRRNANRIYTMRANRPLGGVIADLMVYAAFRWHATVYIWCFTIRAKSTARERHRGIDGIRRIWSPGDELYLMQFIQNWTTSSGATPRTWWYTLHFVAMRCNAIGTCTMRANRPLGGVIADLMVYAAFGRQVMVYIWCNSLKLEPPIREQLRELDGIRSISLPCDAMQIEFIPWEQIDRWEVSSRIWWYALHFVAMQRCTFDALRLKPNQPLGNDIAELMVYAAFGRQVMIYI